MALQYRLFMSIDRTSRRSVAYQALQTALKDSKDPLRTQQYVAGNSFESTHSSAIELPRYRLQLISGLTSLLKLRTSRSVAVILSSNANQQWLSYLAAKRASATVLSGASNSSFPQLLPQREEVQQSCGPVDLKAMSNLSLLPRLRTLHLGDRSPTPIAHKVLHPRPNEHWGTVTSTSMTVAKAGAHGTRPRAAAVQTEEEQIGRAPGRHTCASGTRDAGQDSTCRPGA